jgi:iron complex outermembrane receptor protein
LLASIKSTLKITNDLNYQFLFGGNVKFGKFQLDPTMSIQNVAQATQQGTGELKFGQAGINQIEKFNKTFEHTLNYNKSFSDNFQFDALAILTTTILLQGEVTAKGFNANQLNLIDNIRS